MTNPNLDERNSFSNRYESLDFKEFINLILKNKLLLISITGFSILISFIYIKLKPKVWEGGFQIVVNDKKDPGIFPSGLSDTNQNYWFII